MQGAVYFSPAGKKHIFCVEGVWSHERPQDGSFYVLAPFKATPAQYLHGTLSECALQAASSEGFQLREIDEDEDGFIPMVEHAIREISAPQSGIKKVVLSRRKAFEIRDWDAMEAFQLIQQAYPHAYVSLIVMGDEEWLFASPELLLSQHGSRIKTMSLAGTLPLMGKQAFGEKEFEEQAIVSRYLLRKFELAKVEDISTRGPYERAAGNLKHLCTEISGKIEETDALALAFRLHPSPAIGGEPAEQALSFIDQYEAYDREFYAGFQGWMGPEESWFYVNLRCLKRSGNSIFLYSGAGITSQSEAEKEWDETHNKMQTLLQVLTREPRIL